MKTRMQTLPVVLGILTAFLQVSPAAVTFTLSPSAISNTYSGTIALQVANLTNTETVVVQKFLDANTNGLLDAGDLLWQQFQLTDGSASVFHDGATAVTNFNVPGDMDGTANGSITARLYPSFDFLQLIVGKYLFVLSGPSGAFTPITNTFSVTNFAFAQSFTGNVVSNSTPVPNAIVILLQPSGGGQNPLAGVVADNSGAYSIKAPPGAYTLGAFKANFVTYLSVSPQATLDAGATVTTNVPMSGGTQSISGKCVDADNPSIGLAGCLVLAQATNDIFALAFTDTNGNYSARVTAGKWRIGANNSGLIYKGYLGLQDGIQVDTTTGDVSSVTISLPKATAVFYGTVKDDQYHPVAGVQIYSSDDSLDQYDADTRTDMLGNYVVGAQAGAWDVGADDNQRLGLIDYIVSQGTGPTTLVAGQAYLHDFRALPADHHITGHVQDSDGNPISGVGLYAYPPGLQFFLSTDTDSHGDYSFAVVNGDWTVSVNCYNGEDSLDNIFGNGSYQCPSGRSVTVNNNNRVVDFSILPANGGQIFGHVRNNYGDAVAGVNVFADDGVGHHYSAMTDVGGYYTFGVTNGNLGVSLDCGQLNSLGYQCAGTNNVHVLNDSVETDYNMRFFATPTFPFTVLYSFSTVATNAVSIYTNRDGANPWAGLVLSGDTLYGTTLGGGTNGNGTVFAVNTNITSFKVLHNFSAVDPNTYTNSDGTSPYAGLVLSGNTLYGAADSGGSWGGGAVFGVNTNGTGFTNLHSFAAAPDPYYTNSDGDYPDGTLVLSGNTLYGTAQYGGTNGNGTVFALNTNGAGLTILHTFSAYDQTYYTNSDGVNPFGGLILSGNTLYGMTSYGGSSDSGTIFKINTNGTGFTVLYSFTGGDDGSSPYAGLSLAGNTLYGMATYGGSSYSGTIFKINTNGTGFTVLHGFTGGDDGAYPYAGLVLLNNTLYGAADSGGSAGLGTVFAIGTNGGDFTVLHSFTGGDDGANPDGTLISSGNILYGTTLGGGNGGNGTVFALSITPLPPVLAILHLGTNVVLTWPNTSSTYALQFTTNLGSASAWSTNLPSPIIINGQNVVTNPISGTKMFYRIIQ